MKREFKHIIVNGTKRPYIQDEVLMGDWSDVKDIPAETLKKWTNDPDSLHGLIFKGYEMKWGAVNTNGEKYEQGAFKKFIEEYFVAHKLNMPVTIEHSWSPDHIVGRVLYIETNSTGFYFVAYVPESCPNFARVKWLAQEGLIQGFSKEGYVTDGEWLQDKNGEWYIDIKEIMMTRVSLVCTPANGISFESIKTTNAVTYVDKTNQERKDSVLKTLIKAK